MEVVIEHKGAYRSGVFCLLCTIFSVVAIFRARGELTFPDFSYVIVIFELLLAFGLFMKGKSQEILNAEGITVKSFFRTVTYPWHDVHQYGIDMVLAVRGGKVRSSQKEPRITVFTETKKLKLICREDVLQCLDQYKGAPAYDLRK